MNNWIKNRQNKKVSDNRLSSRSKKHFGSRGSQRGFLRAFAKTIIGNNSWEGEHARGNLRCPLAKDGNALLIAILIMAVLLVVGLGLNRLIVREIAVERGLVQGGQAYYAAEGATEMALYEVNDNLKGYEGEGQSVDLGNGAGYFYEINALGSMWPCADYGNKVYEDDKGVMWRIVESEESVMIPLFTYEEDASDVTDIKDFTLSYFYDVNGPIPSDTPILRWKILGIDAGFTEAISDITEVFGGEYYWTASNTSANYYKKLTCSVWGGCQYDFVAQQVGTFLEDHSYNYMIIANISDVDVAMRLSDSSIGDFVCEYVEIQADGVNGSFIQQIDALIKEGEPLPVFDFVLWEKDPKEWYENTEMQLMEY